MTDASGQVLVLGGTGIIGHHVVRALLARGAKPIVLTYSGNTEFISDIAEKVTLVRGDMTNREQLKEILVTHKPVAIAHLGAALPSLTETNPPAAIRMGVEGVINVFDAACETGIRRVVFASSKSAYGPVAGRYGHPTYEPVPEDYPANPFSVYGITKLTNEQLGRWYALNRGLEFAALRFGSTVGPGKLLRHDDTGIHSLILESVMAGLPVMIEKGGDAVTDIVYNGDIAQGFMGTLFAPKLNHFVYNIATGMGVTLPQFAAAVCRRFPNAQISIGGGPRYLPTENTGHCILDISRAKSDFGYSASADLDRMVDEYLRMMTTMGLKPSLPKKAAAN
jgi:UDP-glucose 4-epimerase